MPRLHHLLLPALVLVFLAIYQICLVDIYSYEGMIPIVLDADFWIIFCVSMFAILLVFPSRIERPSDLFLFFYLLISVLWASALWQGTGLITSSEQPLYFFIVIFPVIAMIAVRGFLSRNLRFFIYPVSLASSSWLPYVLAVFLFIGAAATLATVVGGSFNWEDMYVRRLAAREAYAGQVLAGYATNMATNGVLPILGFVAGYRRSPVLFGVAVVFVVMMFFLLGLKAPAINFVALAGLGFCFRYPGLQRNLVPIILASVLMVYIGAYLAFTLEHNTLLADYLVRRISMVQPQVQSYYFDYWLNREAAEQLLSNARQSFTDTTFAIGFLYFDNPESNANTNAFIYSLANSGVVAYGVGIVAVVTILCVIDVMAEKSGRPEFFAVAALFAILLSEQAWTTVLLTSGIALCLALVMLFSYPSRRNAVTAT